MGHPLYRGRSRWRLTRIAAAMILLGPSALLSASGGQPLHPVILSGSDPSALTAPGVTSEVNHGQVSRNRVIGLSADKHFKSGLYSAQIEEATIESYPVDEFMYFISGGVTLTSADGTVVRAKAGDAVHVPKGWKGQWHTTGYTKFYVVYTANEKK